MFENHLKKLSHDYILRAKRATFIKMFLVEKLKLVKIIFAWFSNTVIVRLAKLTLCHISLGSCQTNTEYEAEEL